MSKIRARFDEWVLAGLIAGICIRDSPVGDKPASESSSAVTPVDRHHSPAGWLLQRQDLAFPFV